MKRIEHRIPEGGAIEDSSEMTMEQYSFIMEKQLGKEYKRFAEGLLKMCTPHPGAAVLEIGPGPGWAGINLLRRRNDLNLTGIEASSDMIRVASANASKEGFAKTKYIIGIVENMNQFIDSQFDLVISRDSLHHWTDPRRAFKEISRVLKPEGNLYIHDSRRDMALPGRIIVSVFSRFIPKNMAFHWKASIAASYTPVEIRRLLSEAGVNNWKVDSDIMDLKISKQ